MGFCKLVNQFFRPVPASLGALVLMALCLCPASEARAATSGVVGFYHLNVPSGNSAWVCGLVTADLYQGAVTSITADVDGKALVSFASPGWTPGSFARHYAEPLTGTVSGLAIDVLSNTANTLKLDMTPAALGIGVGAEVVLRKHVTLGLLFADGGGLEPFGDTVGIISTAGIQSGYLWSNISNTWINGLGANANNTVIRPGQGMVIQVGAAKTLLFGTGEVCHVKTTPTRVIARPAMPNFLGPINPTSSGFSLGALGLTSVFDEYNDGVALLTPGSLAQSGGYLSNGTIMIDGLGATANGVPLLPAASFVIGMNTQKTLLLPATVVSP
jgi:hypothetical protein